MTTPSDKIQMTVVVEAERKTRRKTLFPGKVGRYGLSFNLTALGRQLLKEQAASANVSIADYMELLIRSRVGIPIEVSRLEKRTGPKGGAKSYFFGKNRGRTTAVNSTNIARDLLEEQVRNSGMSRGDYIEFVLRERAGLLPPDNSLVEDPAVSEGVVIGSNVLSEL